MCTDHGPDPARRLLIGASVAGVLALVAGCSSPAADRAAHAAAPPARRTAAPVAAASAGPSASDDPRRLRVVVDKRRPLRPRDWVPQDLVAPRVAHTNPPLLRRPAARALERMVAAARGDGVTVVSLSAYRSYTVQRRVYDRNLASIGRAATERLTLRPGYSEHQTGLAVDLGGASRAEDLRTGFARTDAGRWLRTNSWRHGFVLRYEEGWTAVTGIQFEPWHFRYVGTSLARAYRRSGAHALERFLGLPAAPSYA